jgi:predicted ATP-binding protein involved in virulence
VKVTKLHIDEYKVFKDFDIDFTHNGEAQNLIVLAGINGTGKTTLLKFIFNCVNYRNEFDSKIEKPSYTIVDQPSQDENVYDFTGYYPKGLGNSHDGVFFFYHSPEPNYDEFENGILFFRVKKFILSYSLDPIPDSQVIRDFVDYYIYEKSDSAFVGYQALQNDFDKILHDFDLGLKFKVLKGGKTAIFIDNKGTELTMDDLSTGEKQILSLVIQLFVAKVKDSIILIDEPEFSLHPSWQNKIVGVLQKYAKEYNCQVILATHSPHIIGSVKPEQLRLLYKDDSGAIKVKSHVSGSYGWPVDKVLVGLMDVDTLRTPEAAKDLDDLNDMVRRGEFESDEFNTKMQKLEEAIGADDDFLTRLRFEIIKRKKESAANK